MQPVLGVVVLHKCLGVAAEVGRDRLALPLGKQSLAEKDDDDDRPDKLRYAEHGPRKETDVAGAELLGLRGGDDIDGRAEHGELGTLQARECERDHQLRRCDSGPDRDDDGHRQHGGDGKRSGGAWASWKYRAAAIKIASALAAPPIVYDEAAGKFTHRRLRWVTRPDERQCPVNQA